MLEKQQLRLHGLGKTVQIAAPVDEHVVHVLVQLRMPPWFFLRLRAHQRGISHLTLHA